MLQTPLQRWWCFTLIAWVSSPQGNATNNNTKHVWRFVNTSFKSPRECYKLFAVGSATSSANQSFQVPKGMLQTIYGETIRIEIYIISSPQGNATNISDAVYTHVLSKNFKSPRECYKPLTPLTVFRIHKAISSPQGNATNTCGIAQFPNSA